MEPNYTSIGTTNRSDPVDSMTMLYPNGYNRNENRSSKPLIQVLDTAGIDDGDFDDEDFDFKSGSPSENVTVTIKFSSETDSVIAEKRDANLLYGSSTDSSSRQPLSKSIERSNDRPTDLTCLNDNITQNNETENASTLEGRLIGAYALEMPQQTMDSDTEPTGISRQQLEVSEQIEEICTTESPPLGACAMNATKETDKGFVVRTQDTLYDEYDKFLEKIPSQTISKHRAKGNTISTINDMGNGTDTTDNGIALLENVRERVCENKTETSGNDCCNPKNVSIAVKNEVKPDIRVKMVSPITKTPIFVERSSSEDDEGEDFMKYLKELRNSSPDGTEIEEDECVNLTDRPNDDLELPLQARNDSNELSIVEIDDPVCENTTQSTPPIITEIPSSDNLIDMIEISDEDDVDKSVIIVSDEDVDQDDNTDGLINFDFASLNSSTGHKNEDCENGDKNKSSKIAYSVIEIPSDSSSDSEEEEEQDKKKSKDDTSNPEKRRKDKDQDKDKGNGSSNNGSGGNQNFTNPGDDDRNRNEGNGGSNDNTDGSNSRNNTFSPGMRSRQSDECNVLELNCNDSVNDASETFQKNVVDSDILDATETFQKNVVDFDMLDATEIFQNNIVDSDKLAPCDKKEVYSPEDIEVYQILDTCEKQNDIIYQFQTIDSYCFDTLSENSVPLSTSCNSFKPPRDTASSNSRLTTDKHSPYSNSVSLCASTCSFDVFGVSSSNTSEVVEDDYMQMIGFFENEIEPDENINCDNEINLLCSEIQSHYDCINENEKEASNFSENENLSLLSDSVFSDTDDSSSINETADVSDFESAIEEQFWANTADCSVERSDSEEVISGDDSDCDLERDKHKSFDEKEKDSDSEYESVEEEEGFETDGSDFDFVREIESRLLQSKLSSYVSTVDTSCPVNDSKEDCQTILSSDSEDFKERHDSGPEAEFTLNQFKRNQITSFKDRKHKPSHHANSMPETRSHRDNLTALMNNKPRTITYQIPYIKEYSNPEVNYRSLKKWKILCSLRKALLHKVIPKPDESMVENGDTGIDNLSESIKQLKESIDFEDIRKTSTEKSDDGNPLGKQPQTGETISVGHGYYIFGTGDTLHLPVGPKLRQGFQRKDNSARPAIYFRGENLHLLIVFEFSSYDSVKTYTILLLLLKRINKRHALLKRGLNAFAKNIDPC